LNQGFIPDSFSTDLHGLSINGTAYNTCNIMSKMWACCKTLSLTDIISRVSNRPAKFLDLDGVGTLSIGSDADIAVFSIKKGEFGFQDMSGGKVMNDKRFECEMTFRDGNLVYDINGRAAVPFEQLDPLYGYDPKSEDLIIPTYN
jgi:dihydroorotase